MQLPKTRVVTQNALAMAQECESEEPFKSMTDKEQRQTLVKELHLLKTDLFMKMVEDGMMPLRPGVKRLVSASPLSPLACSRQIHLFSEDALAVGAAKMNSAQVVLALAYQRHLS